MFTLRSNTLALAATLAAALLALPMVAVAQDDAEVVPAREPGSAVTPDPIAPEANATDPGEEMAEQAAQGRVLRAHVQAIRGSVQYRESPQDDWKKAEPGLELTQGAQFRTGLRSAVQLLIEPDHQVTIDRLGVVSLLQAIQNEDGLVKTNLGMKYGRTEYKVQAGGAEHESTISAPGMTLAIRSTDSIVGFDPAFGGEVRLTDSPRSRVNNRRQRLIQMANGRLDENDSSPGENALGRNVVEAFRTYDSTEEDGHDRRHLPGYEYIRREGGLGFRGHITRDNLEAFNPRFDVIETDLSPLNFRIFDLGVEDGDRVNVYWNGTILSSNLTLTSDGKGLRVFPFERSNNLAIEAVGFGEDNDLTAGVEIPEGGAVFNVSFPNGQPGAVQHIGVIYTGESYNESTTGETGGDFSIEE